MKTRAQKRQELNRSLINARLEGICASIDRHRADREQFAKFLDRRIQPYLNRYHVKIRFASDHIYRSGLEATLEPSEGYSATPKQLTAIARYVVELITGHGYLSREIYHSRHWSWGNGRMMFRFHVAE